MSIHPNYTSAVTDSIINAVGKDNYLAGDAIGADYQHDEYPGGNYLPDAVVIVKSTENISQVMKICSEAGVPVTVRGSGTGQVGGSVPINGGVVIYTGAMKEILAVDKEAKTIRAQAGALLQSVKEEAEKCGLCYPPDPGEKTATIGGNAATNASGPSAVKYGTTCDYVVDAVVVKADGTIAKLSEDPSLAAVLGSEGTLAVISEVTLRLVEKPGWSAILLLPFSDTETCIAAARMIADKGFAPAVTEYMDTDIVEFSGNITGNPVFPVEMDGERVAATLMVTFEAADEDSGMEALENVAELAEELGCLDMLIGDTPTMKRDFWAAHDAFHTSMEGGARNSVEYNITVPADKMAEMADYAKDIAESKDMKAMMYGHVVSGGMHIHVISDADKAVFLKEIPAVSDAIHEKCVRLGGNAAGEYGIGYAKNKYFAASEAYSAAKAELDPNGLMNPGKLVGEGVKEAPVKEKVTETSKTRRVEDKEASVSDKAEKERPADSADLKILCCVKQVPDVDQMRMDPETGLLVRSGVPAILNPQDANALSAALMVKETYGGEITLITMGPPMAEAALRECMAVGADKAILVTDRAFGNADTLATSYSILSAADTQGKFDMIFAGKESIDGATGQMGAQLAERFDMAQVTSARLIKEVDAEKGTVVVERTLDNGVEELEVKMPVLFTIEKENYPVRVPNLKGKMAAKKKEIITITADDIPGLDRSRIGDPGSPTKVPRMFPPVMPEPGMILDEGSTEATVAKLFALIKD